MATLTEVFSEIAEAINSKGVAGSMKPTEMAEKIVEIPSGGDVIATSERHTDNSTITITITANTEEL